MNRTHTEVLLVSVIVILFWLIAVLTWWTSLWHADAFTQFGADLPTATIVVLSASTRAVVPFGLAVLFTAVLVYETFRRTPRALLVAVWLLCIATALSLSVIVATGLPMMRMCGQFVPDRLNTFGSV